ncbi:hypothetical protein GWR56_13060 [Mucilaginibacter sp. 14171R-50]|uniref:DUF5977 domain-containing protein n=1 Tax=Mucilaginibacter sp. 14171R-50 TaxID=2703789 RepID=UPI00138C0D1D|nr:DUF5977 domain-containing protein [Mucilaginibacter sp. 14171R-50]QHS56420.1 hypothetical protein GWR56_13060 [Mucilaginibacter sp. 14171R-50]
MNHFLKKKWWLTLLLSIVLLPYNEIFAQSKPYSLVIPPSPNSASIGKFGDIPLNYSSGLPNISIPLLDLKEGSLALPISINYNYGGFRPSDQPGVVGRGWSLMAGGVISRVVNGLPDELHGSTRLGYLYNSANIKSLLKVNDSLNCQNQSCPSCFVDGNCDGEPDMFYFSFGNISGKFFFGDDGLPHIVSDRKLKIEYHQFDTPILQRIYNGISTNINGFTITTEDGTVYRFGDPTPKAEVIPIDPMKNVEFSYSQHEFWDPLSTAYLTPISAWLLYEIEDTDGNKIKLSYLNDYKDNQSYFKLNRQRITKTPFQVYTTTPHSSEEVAGFDYSISSENFVTKIEGSTWKVDFSYNNLESDTALHTLNSVLLSLTNGNEIKRYNATYSSTDMKCLLTGLKEKAITGGTAVYKTHAFEYTPFPATYYILGLDYWGYYNGVNNADLIPVSPYTANREPSFSNTVLGALKKITYPTGGTSSFEYEQNEYSYIRQDTTENGQAIGRRAGGGIRLKKMIDSGGNGMPAMTKEYSYNKFNNLNLSSGVALAPVNKFFFTFQVSQISGKLAWLFGGEVPDTTVNWNIWKSDPFYTLSQTPIYYFNVRETTGSTIRTDYEFTSHLDYPDYLGVNYGLGTNQVGPYESYDFARSLPKSVKQYQNNAIVSETQTAYTMTEKFRSRRLWRQTAISRSEGSFQFAKGVAVISGLIQKKSDSTLYYYPAGNYMVRNIYEYDSTYYSLRKQIQYNSRITSSTPGTVETRYKYPFDYAGGVYPAMISKNIISPVIEEQKLVNGNQVNYTLKDFGIYNNGTLYKPSTVKVQTLSTNPLITKSEVTKYTSNGNIEEVLLDTKTYQSYRWGYNQQYPIAEVKNAMSAEFFYEGFEKKNGTTVSGGDAHTGLRYSTNASVSWAKPNNREYVISYWYKDTGAWKYSGELPYTGNSFILSGGTAFDDICIYPIDAQISTYTYMPLIGLGTTTDVKGLTNYYSYDGFNRLMDVKDQDGNIVKSYCYNYQGGSTNCFVDPLIYKNDEIITTHRKECGVHYLGSLVTYKVFKGTYLSTISQADADQRAQTDADVQGQLYANSDPDATCTLIPCYSYTFSANQGFSATYHYKDCEGIDRTEYVEQGHSVTLCAREGTVNGGPYIKGTACPQ